MTDSWGSIYQEEVRVVFHDGSALDGHLHLLSRVNYPPGPETPLEMLNRPDAFFALTGAQGGPVLIAKAQAEVVSCRQGSVPTDPERLSAARFVPIDVVMVSGVELRGQSVLELPPGRTRTLDFVNAPGQFFGLWSGDVTHFVNKSLVRLIRPLD
ncbi:MAG TPA: hypothetical protein VFM14_17135 [Gemmatimonadales bacterium]|nr:hypothetical protein [Gemmatimonadales bacterium]